VSAPAVIDTSAAAPADVHPAIAAPLAALDDAGVRWCLLRGTGDLTRLSGDVDLLVHPDDLGVARRVLTGDGDFVELRAWGRRPHRFFVAHVAREAAWVKLDIVTALHFGPRQQLRTRAAEAVLESARRDGALVLPAPADAFWVALLHAVLDRGVLRPERAREVQELAGDARGADGPLAAIVDGICPDGWSAARVIGAAAEGRLGDVLALRAALSAGWPGPPRRIRDARRALRIALRRLDRARPRRPGPTVAIIGGGPRARSELAAAMAQAWPERATRVTGGTGLAWAAARARGRLVVLDAPDGGRAASRADVRVRLTAGCDLLELRRSALGAAWQRRVAQQSGRMTSKSRSRSKG
jgi:hypothetical protein